MASGPTDIDAVIFDLDGILVDSERIYVAAWHTVADELECPQISAICGEVIGLPYDRIEPRIKAALPARVSYGCFRSAMNAVLTETLANGYPLKTGAVEILQFLQQHRVPCAVATSSTTTVPAKLQDNRIDHYFQEVVRRDQVAEGKPQPDIYLAAAERLQCPPARCLALEDSEPGLTSAQAAGLRVVHVPDIAVVNPRLLANCAAQFETLLAVRDWLDQPAFTASR